MVKKKEPPESQEVQSERFNQAVRDAEAAGELNPIEADKLLDVIVKKSADNHRP